MPRAKPIPHESYEQRALVQWLTLKGIGHFAVPNSGSRDVRYAKRLKAEGVRAGVPDLILTRLAYEGKPVAIEMKRKGGRLSTAQSNVINEMLCERWIVLVCYGFDDAIKQITEVYSDHDY